MSVEEDVKMAWELQQTFEVVYHSEEVHEGQLQGEGEGGACSLEVGLLWVEFFEEGVVLGLRRGG